MRTAGVAVLFAPALVALLVLAERGQRAGDEPERRSTG